jgi:hypothetical protein
MVIALQGNDPPFLVGEFWLVYRVINLYEHNHLILKAERTIFTYGEYKNAYTPSYW